MTIKEIRLMTNLSQNKFSKKYNIPVGTLRHWEQGLRPCPTYVLELLEYRVKKELEEGN